MGVSRLLTGALAGLFVLGAPVASPGQERPAPPEAHGERAGGWLGLGLDHEMRCPRGAAERTAKEDCDHALLIETVVVGSPADEAGVMPGDTVITANGRGLFTERGKLDIPSFAVGEEMRLVLGREGGRVTVTVIAGQRPARAMVPMKVHRRAHHPEAPPAPDVSDEVPRILVAPMPSGSDAAARAGTVRARARVIHDSVLAAAREQLDSVRKIRRKQMEELHARLREVRQAASDVEREEREEAAARVERSLERRAEQMRRLDSAFRAWEPPAPPEAYRSVSEAGLASRVHRLGGAELLALHPELARSFPGVESGLLVLRTVEGTPAAEAGLRPGDVIVEAAGLSIARASDLKGALVGHAERDSTVVTWVRGGERMQGVMHDR